MYFFCYNVQTQGNVFYLSRMIKVEFKTEIRCVTEVVCQSITSGQKKDELLLWFSAEKCWPVNYTEIKHISAALVLPWQNE